jgi:hypothetical protein
VVANPGVCCASPEKDAAAGWMTETKPTTSRRGMANMMSPRAVGPRGGGAPRGSGKRKGAPGLREGAGSSGSPGAAAGVSAGASGDNTLTVCSNKFTYLLESTSSQQLVVTFIMGLP